MATTSKIVQQDLPSPKWIMGELVINPEKEIYMVINSTEDRFMGVRVNGPVGQSFPSILKKYFSVFIGEIKLISQP